MRSNTVKMGGQWRKIFGTIDTNERVNIFSKQSFPVKKWVKKVNSQWKQVISQNMGKHLNSIINKCGERHNFLQPKL